MCKLAQDVFLFKAWTHKWRLFVFININSYSKREREKAPRFPLLPSPIPHPLSHGPLWRWKATGPLSRLRLLVILAVFWSALVQSCVWAAQRWHNWPRRAGRRWSERDRKRDHVWISFSAHWDITKEAKNKNTVIGQKKKKKRKEKIKLTLEGKSKKQFKHWWRKRKIYQGEFFPTHLFAT